MRLYSPQLRLQQINLSPSCCQKLFHFFEPLTATSSVFSRCFKQLCSQTVDISQGVSQLFSMLFTLSHLISFHGHQARLQGAHLLLHDSLIVFGFLQLLLATSERRVCFPQPRLRFHQSCLNLVLQTGCCTGFFLRFAKLFFPALGLIIGSSKSFFQLPSSNVGVLPVKSPLSFCSLQLGNFGILVHDKLLQISNQRQVFCLEYCSSQMLFRLAQRLLQHGDRLLQFQVFELEIFKPRTFFLQLQQLLFKRFQGIVSDAASLDAFQFRSSF